jgi:diadenylate cyclase
MTFPGDPKDFVEIILIFLVLYLIFRFMQGTIAGTIVRGFGFLLIISLFLALYVLSSLELEIIGVIFRYLLGVSLTALIIIFQPELRRGLLRLGRNPFIGRLVVRESHVIDEVVKAALTLSKDRIGALIAFEGEVALNPYIESGVRIDAVAKAELIDTIFWPGSALHDGGVIIRDDRLAAAACLFPLTENPELSRDLGTRHRAAIGLSEESDAVCVVVSEETGTISVTRGGSITRDHDEDTLRSTLRQSFGGAES